MSVIQRIKSRPQRELVVLALLALVVVMLIAFVVLNLGGGEETAIDTGPPVGPRPTTPAPTVSPTAPPPLTGEAFEGRDPFVPLISEGGGGGGGGDGGGTGNGGGSNGGGGGDDGDGGGGSGDGSTGGTPTSRRVTLLDIFTEGGTRRASVEVDRRNYTVREGERFADNFRLIDLTSRCGTFVYGDERFTLCVGQEVRK